MPSQTYIVGNGYASGDFFYNNTNEFILQTLNFNNQALWDWVSYTSKSAEIPQPPDLTTSTNTTANKIDWLFNDKIYNVIRDNSTNFINGFLPSNINISQSFTDINGNVPITGFNSANSGALNAENATLNLTFMDNNNSLQQMNNIQIAGKYTTDSSGKLKLDVTNANAQGAAVGSSITLNQDVSGGTDQLSITDINPRCRFQEKCVINHAHYSKCKTQLFADDKGLTYCKCICDGPIVTDDQPHTHCSPYDIKQSNEPGYDANIDGKYIGGGGLNDQILRQSFNQFNSKIQNMHVELAGVIPQVDGNNISVKADYSDIRNLDATVRQSIYDYYIEVGKNKRLKEKIIGQSGFDLKANQLIFDATMNYRKKYLELFNIASGIIMASGYIYIFAKTLPYFNKK